MDLKGKNRGFLILSQVIIQGGIPKIPYLRSETRSGVGVGVNDGGSTFPFPNAIP